MIDLYNGFSLCRGDSDITRTYGGEVRSLAQVGSGDHVVRLRKDLQELGFFLANPRPTEDPAKFDLWLEEAVREFQVMARLAGVAHERAEPIGDTKYLLRLETVVVPPDDRYPGPESGETDRFASGVVNPNTRRIIALWKDKRWRCPWVIAEWMPPVKPKKLIRSVKPKPKPAPAPPSPDEWKVGQRTFKRHDLCVVGRTPKVTGEVFLHDFSQRYFEVANPSLPDMRFYLGMELGYRSRRGPGGKAGQPDTQKLLIKISPELLTGGAIADADSAQASTFRVVAGVASIEASDGFQFVNAWDLAVLSAGLYHFTLMSVTADKNKVLKFGKGELLGLLSWMEKHWPGQFADFVGNFGLRSALAWGTDGSTLFNRRNGIWESYLCRESVSNLRGQPVTQHESALVLQSWQWLARFNMLPFVSPAYREANWMLARLRLRSICALQIGGTFPKAWRIGDVFTSERLIAKLLRVHVHRSGRLSWLPTATGPATCAPWIPTLLEKKLTADEIKAGPGKWGDSVQQKLETQLDLTFKEYTATKRSGKDLIEGDFTRLTRWAFDGRGLSAKANSFKLFAGDNAA